jgi:8-oxo-dGTP diphosphatase
MEKIIIVSGPVIVKENKVLLDIQGDDSFWKFCGGKVRNEETLAQTAIRRAKEELGINIAITNSIPFLLHSTKGKNGEIFDVVLAHFLTEFSGDIQPGNEVKEWKWIPLEDLPNENLAPNIIPTLKHFGFLK